MKTSNFNNSERENGESQVKNNKRMSKTAQLQQMIEGTAFTVRTSGGHYIFERTENDGTFIPDYQSLPNFDAAWEWADSIAKTTALYRLEEEMENPKDCEGARFKIGDRVRMKHDGATGTIARVWDGYDGFSYEVTRDVPIEGLEPGSEVWEALPQESGLEPLEPVSEITEANRIKVGDRVWCKHGEVMGTVTAIRIWNSDYAFKVKMDKEVTLFGQTFDETEYRRAGITKNYGKDGVIVGNEDYYAEQLRYGTGCIHEYELGGVGLRVESTREGVYPGLNEGWGNEYRVAIRHKNGNDQTDTMTLKEVAQLLARLYVKENVAA